MNGNVEQRDDVPQYVITESEQVESDREKVFLRFNSYNPEYAIRWLEALNKEISDLSEFPGPLANAIDASASLQFKYEVRRLLFHGPRRRKSKFAYHILYTVFPPYADNVQVIRVLRILHATRDTREETGDSEDSL